MTTNLEGLLDASALLLLWRRGFVEDVVPPPHPRHLAAQQLLALALQEGRFAPSAIEEWWGDLPLMTDGPAVLDYLCSADFLVEESGLLSIGPRAEKEFGKRHFIELLSSFVAPPSYASWRVLRRSASFRHSRSPHLLIERRSRLFSPDAVGAFETLIGRDSLSGLRRCLKGDVKWPSDAIALSYEMSQARRRFCWERPQMSGSPNGFRMR